MRRADMKRHERKRKKKIDAERGLALFMLAINNDLFGVLFFSPFFLAVAWFGVTFGMRYELVSSISL